MFLPWICVHLRHSKVLCSAPSSDCRGWMPKIPSEYIPDYTAILILELLHSLLLCKVWSIMEYIFFISIVESIYFLFYKYYWTMCLRNLICRFTQSKLNAYCHYFLTCHKFGFIDRVIKSTSNKSVQSISLN